MRSDPNNLSGALRSFKTSSPHFGPAIKHASFTKRGTVGFAGTLLLFAFAATPTLAQNYDQACRKLEGEYISLSQQLRSGSSGRGANEAYKRQLDNIRQIEDQEARLGCHSSFSPPYQCANMANAKQAMYNNLNKLAAEVEMNGQHILRDRLQAVEQALFNMNCSGRANSNTTYATGTAPVPAPSYGGSGRPAQGGYDYAPPSIPVEPLRPQTSTTYSASSGSVNSNGSDVQFHQSVKQSFQTMCVRTCDGYYFPMSNTSNATVFVEDEDVCRAMCPGQKMELYVFRSPEEQVGQMRSLSGAPYSALPNAYKFQQGEISGCACEGQTERAAVPAPHEGGFVQSPSEDVITEGEALPSLVPGDTGGATSTVSVPDKPAIPLPSELMEVTPEEPSEKGIPVEEEKALPRKVEPKTGPIRQVGPKYFADQ